MRKLDLAVSKMFDYVLENKLFQAGGKLLLCVSGGADSVALLHLMSRLRSRQHVTLLAVHVDHQLRGAESTADATLVKELCQQLNIPVIVRKIKLESRRDLENQARKKRYEIFDQLLELYKFDSIVTGHHKNDQAETMLMNLFRGAGINGLAGIKPASGRVIHPLLCFSKRELVELLQAEDIAWREDASNSDESFRRNRIRNSLLPLIESGVNPSVVENLSSQARIFLEADRLLRKNALKQLKKACREQTPEQYVLSVAELKKLSPVEQYYALKAAIANLSGSEQDFFRHGFEAIVSLLEAEGSKYLDLAGGIRIKKQYGELIVSLKPGEEPKPEPYVVEEDRNRAVYGSYRFSFKTLKVLPRDRHEDGLNVYLDADKIRFPFTIRGRREGDRFIPLGMKDRKKVKDLLIDCKVPKFERDRVPICDDGEKIFWVVGYRVDARVAVDANSSRYLHITAEPVHEKPKRAASRIKTGESDEQNEL